MQTPRAALATPEAQDLNRAQHRFLRECVAPPGGATVLCAVGDPMQAIYAFRGADPDSMENLATLFAARRMQLTCCFRCPRRVVFVAAQLKPDAIRAARGALLGRVAIQATSNHRLLDVCLAVAHAHGPGTTLFVARNNHTLLDLLRTAHVQSDGGVRLRWVSPALQRLLVELRAALPARGCHSVAQAIAVHRAESALPDRSLLRVLDVALQLEGPSAALGPSPWLDFVTAALGGDDDGPAALTLATVHAIKGQEWDHVLVWEYNLFGVGHAGADSHPDQSQEQNLLYIALTRSRRSLTLLLNRRTQGLPSPFLPIDMAHFATDLWAEEEQEAEGDAR